LTDDNAGGVIDRTKRATERVTLLTIKGLLWKIYKSAGF
jgi:hypothetical protein